MVTNKCAIGTKWAETRDAAKHPTMYGQPYNRELSGPKYLAGEAYRRKANRGTEMATAKIKVRSWNNAHLPAIAEISAQTMRLDFFILEFAKPSTMIPNLGQAHTAKASAMLREKCSPRLLLESNLAPGLKNTARIDTL